MAAIIRYGMVGGGMKALIGEVHRKALKFDNRVELVAGCFSSHADRTHLLEWAEHFQPRPKQVFVVHGDAPVTEIFANTLREMGLSAHAPLYEEVFDLAANKMLAAGVELAPKKGSFTSDGSRPSNAYHELERAAMDLVAIIHASKGSPNKDLKKMTNQLRAVIEKWNSVG